MRLAAEEDVVKLMGAVNNAGSLGNAGVALEVTSEAIATKLDSALLAASYTDYFSYSTSRYQGQYVPMRYRLSAGFVDAATVSVRESLLGTPSVDGDSGTAVDPADYLLDPVKGVLTFRRAPPMGSEVVTVKYDAGFSQDSNGVLADIPPWLSKVGILAAVRLLQMNPANFVARKAVVMKDIQNALMGEVSMILNARMRPRMELVWPDRADVEQ